MGEAKVLFVDDEPKFLESVRTIFELNGIPALCVRSGEEALEAVNNERFDIIFTDMTMDGMNGMEFTRLVRERHPDAEIYLVSGNFITPALSSAASQAGIAGIIMKPLDMNEILDMIRRLSEP